ncbi:MAG: hypothetical protein HZA91_09640 [Verrucomicrobia bacterium]|nr:hypothetical protein [Verrucomicrobiota bacterium]
MAKEVSKQWRDRCLRWIMGVLLAASAISHSDAASLQADSLRVELDERGAITKLGVGPCAFVAGKESAGLWVREAPDGPLLRAGLGNSKDRTTELSEAGLKVSGRVEAHADHLLVCGVVEDTRRAADRAVDVVFRLPFAPATWWASVSKQVPPGTEQPAERRAAARELPEGAAVLEKIEDGDRAQNFMPVACVTDPKDRAGIAVAIPPDAPCRFRFAYLPQPGCVELQFLFGLSQAAPSEFNGRAPFRFIIYPVDGHWGLRDALRRYYAMFPAAFERRTKTSGLWLVSMPSLKDVNDPENYAFWQATRLSETKMAQAVGLEVYPYTIVGQREICYLKQKPAGYEGVLAALTTKPETTRKGRYPWEEVKPVVESSGLLDPNGRRVYRLRQTEWGGDSISFPVNPSPHLPVSAGHPTVASHTFAEVERVLREHPEIAGFFVDSLAMWGSYENYRRDHYAAVRAPLTHDAAGRVCLPNWMPHVDYLKELHRRIGPRLVFANGVRPGRAFCAFECDILGVENSLRELESRTQMDFLRVMAGPNPALCLLNHQGDQVTRAVAEEYVQRFIALGLAPEMRRVPWPLYKQRDADLYARFMPVYRRLDRAGWQPVTHATVAPGGIWVERFGTRPPELYFTLYNPTSTNAQARLTINRDVLNIPASASLRELVESREKLNLAEPLALPPHSLRIVQFVEP